jgi:hypothetical protein
MTSTSSPLNEVHQAVQLLNDGRARVNEGRDRLAKLVGHAGAPFTPEQLNLLVTIATLSSGPVEDIALGFDATATVPRANVARIAGVRAKDAPSLKQGIVAILQEFGRTMSADEIYAEVEKRGWLPEGAAEPRKYVGHYLSTYNDVFLRDTAMGRGHYYLDGLGTKSDAAAPAVKLSAKAVVKAKRKQRKLKAKAKLEARKAKVAAKAPEKKVEKKSVTPRILEVLLKAKEPVTIPDISKAARLGAEYRSVTALFMTMEKTGAAKRVGRHYKGEFRPKTNESGHTLWEIDPANLRDFAKAYRASQAN